MGYRPKSDEAREYDRKRYRKLREERPEFYLLKAARRRAKNNDLEFNIDESDIIIPQFCPYLNIPLFINPTGKAACDNSPTLDRIRNELGYVKGNIIVVSFRANRMKSNYSFEELKLLVTNLQSFV